jgi:hypothetical protein
MALELAEVLLGSLWAVSCWVIWKRLKWESARIEVEMKRAFAEIESQVEEVAIEVRETLEEVEGEVREAVDVDIFDQMELMRQGMMNNLMQMGIGFVGKKLGMEMGVHQIEPPDDQGEPHSAGTDEFAGIPR